MSSSGRTVALSSTTASGAVAAAAGAVPVTAAVSGAAGVEADASTSRYPFFSFSAIVLTTWAAAASADAYSLACVRPSLPHRP